MVSPHGLLVTRIFVFAQLTLHMVGYRGIDIHFSDMHVMCPVNGNPPNLLRSPRVGREGTCPIM